MTYLPTLLVAAVTAALTTPAMAGSAAFGRAQLSDEALSQVRGREDTSQVAINILTSELANTSVGDNVNTGSVGFDANAFSNLNGFALVSSNTGNNVSFNANMTVNVIVNN